jgi:DNA ligase-1
LKRQFLQLAHNFDPNKHLASGALLSEKLDGMRCFWDGGVSRGLPKLAIPWANLEKDRQEQTATGLWSRYGNVIHAPDWWLDHLPSFMLDGELWAGRGTFQTLRSIASRLPENAGDWKGIVFKVFDMPRPESIFAPGTINVTNFHKTLSPSALKFAQDLGVVTPKVKQFADVYRFLKKYVGNGVVQVLEQQQLPFGTERALAIVEERLNEVTDKGGEGLMLRRTHSIWVPGRTHDLVKIKKLLDAEAEVVGYTTARETAKGSKLLGLMGALVVKYNNQVFELSGFTDNERVLVGGDEREVSTNIRPEARALIVEPKAYKWAIDNPSPENGAGTRVPDWIGSINFPRGSRVTFRYRELTNDGIPKEARYFRKD